MKDILKQVAIRIIQATAGKMRYMEYTDEEIEKLIKANTPLRSKDDVDTLMEYLYQGLDNGNEEVNEKQVIKVIKDMYKLCKREGAFD